MDSRRESFQRNGRQVCAQGAERHTTLKEEQVALWEADRASWASGQPATAWLASHLSLVPTCDPRLPTATTDGRDLLFNATWSVGLDTQTRRFLQAHLVWHCVAGHLHTPREVDRRRWHLACDHEVNTALLMQGLPLPPQAVLFPACIGRPLSAVYAWLADSPLLDYEHSLDAPPWIAAAAEPSLVDTWAPRVDELVRRHLGSPLLPRPVAAWLLGRW